MNLAKFLSNNSFPIIVLLAIIAGAAFLMWPTGGPIDDSFDVASVPSVEEAKANVEIFPTADNYIILGLAYYYADEFKKSIAVTEKVLELDPNNAIAYNNIGAAYNVLEMWDEAIEALSKALDIDPDFELARNNLFVAEEGKRQ